MELNSQILKWLNNHGYQLEMNISNKLANAGFLVRNSYYYTDPDTNTFREIDIVSNYIDITGLLEIDFVFECKSSVGKPFVVFTSDNLLNNRNQLMLYSYSSSSVKNIIIDNIDKIDMIPWFNKKRRVGHNFVQAFKDSQKDTYQAIMGVLKASQFICDENKTNQINAFNFVFPTIVVEGNLFECYLNERNEIQLDEISQCFLLNDIKICNEFPPCINIIKSNYIDNFITEANEVITIINSLCKDKINETLNQKLK